MLTEENNDVFITQWRGHACISSRSLIQMHTWYTQRKVIQLARLPLVLTIHKTICSLLKTEPRLKTKQKSAASAKSKTCRILHWEMTLSPLKNSFSVSEPE